MKRFLLAIVGSFFILLGIVGLLLPILPGWPFIFAGLSFIVPRFAEQMKRKVLRRFARHEIVSLEPWRKSGVYAGFTTRHFPLLLSKTGDLSVPENQSRFKKMLAENAAARKHGLNPVSKFAFPEQVHGNQVAVLDGLPSGDFHCLRGTDGAITDQKGLALLVLTADCLSVFLRAPGWVGLVHAGWRGTRGGITKNAFELLKARSGCSHAEIQVIFGPCIGPSRYEVGPEFRDIFPKRSWREKKGKLYFDLAGENKRQLLDAGASERRITELHYCTVEENEDFYSFRKEGAAAGRQASFIVMQD